jgi:hypothetical protein
MAVCGTAQSSQARPRLSDALGTQQNPKRIIDAEENEHPRHSSGDEVPSGKTNQPLRLSVQKRLGPSEKTKPRGDLIQI